MVLCFFFFKQKTAYEMRISDWSSDVCSSDLASKLQMAFDLEWSGKSGEGAVRTESMVLRMEPPEAIVETSRLREFEILGVAGDVVPVPLCYWVDAEGAYLQHPALIYGFAAGTTKP